MSMSWWYPAEAGVPVFFDRRLCLGAVIQAAKKAELLMEHVIRWSVATMNDGFIHQVGWI
jgi:hypothetical protein